MGWYMLFIRYVTKSRKQKQKNTINVISRRAKSNNDSTSRRIPRRGDVTIEVSENERYGRLQPRLTTCARVCRVRAPTRHKSHRFATHMLLGELKDMPPDDIFCVRACHSVKIHRFGAMRIWVAHVIRRRARIQPELPCDVGSRRGARAEVPCGFRVATAGCHPGEAGESVA